MSTQLYKITRRGILHSRLEWPNGEPVKGSRFRMNDRYEYVPIERNGGKPVRRYYGTKPSSTGETVSQFIRLTHEAYRKLRHEWGLELAIVPGVDRIEKARDPNPIDVGTTDENGNGGEDISLPPANVKAAPPVEIPANWRNMNQSALSKIVSDIHQQPYKSLPKEQAVALIEAYLEEVGRNGGEA